MPIKRYRIDFYQISVTATAEISTPGAGFLAMLAGERDCTHNDGSYTREIYGLTNRRSSIAGRLRKLRITDLPEIGRLGADAEEIMLENGQGLIEQNFFVWYQEHNVLAWHVNGHASPALRFQAFLSHTWGTQVHLEPLIQTDALRRLLSGDVEMKKLFVTLPRPTNPELFPDDDYSRGLLEIMNQSGADGMRLEMGVNLKTNRGGRLINRMKRFLGNMAEAGATTAKAIVEENGDTHPIDLVADRVSTSVASDANARYPEPVTMYQLIDDARAECQEAINDYFGSVDRALR